MVILMEQAEDLVDLDQSQWVAVNLLASASSSVKRCKYLPTSYLLNEIIFYMYSMSFFKMLHKYKHYFVSIYIFGLGI